MGRAGELAGLALHRVRRRGDAGGSERAKDLVRTGTTVDQMVRAIADRIVTGALRPGDRLDEMSLAARFEVSRTPIREALGQLGAMGLVDRRPNRGAIVAVVTQDHLSSMFESMAELEGICARFSAERMTADERRGARARAPGLGAAGPSRRRGGLRGAQHRVPHPALSRRPQQAHLRAGDDDAQPAGAVPPRPVPAVRPPGEILGRARRHRHRDPARRRRRAPAPPPRRMCRSSARRARCSRPRQSEFRGRARRHWPPTPI